VTLVECLDRSPRLRGVALDHVVDPSIAEEIGGRARIADDFRGCSDIADSSGVFADRGDIFLDEAKLRADAFSRGRALPGEEQKHNADASEQHDAERIALAALHRRFLGLGRRVTRHCAHAPNAEPCKQTSKANGRPDENARRCDVAEEARKIARERNDTADNDKQWSALRPDHAPQSS
jgi:hypothetical protein